MEAPVLPKHVYRFGLFQVDPESGKLLRQGAPVKLQEQPFRVLCLLLERPGEIVTRDELQQTLWPEGTYVEFEGSLNAALKRLRLALGDDAENPIFIETVPRRGYRFIAPVSDARAETLKTTANQHLDAGAPARTSAPAIAPPVQRPLLRLYHFYVVAGIALLIVVGLVWFPTHSRQANSSKLRQASAQAPVRKSVAVLGFHNASGRPQDDWLSTATSEMLSTELATGEKLRVVSGEEVANLRISSPWSQTSTLGQETTARIGTALDSDVLVLGSYTAIGAADHEQLRFDVRLQDARTGNVLSQIAQTGNGNDLFQVASEIGARLRQQMGVPEIKDTEQAEVLASLPRDRDGARFYALGIAKLRDFDALAAKDLLEQAVRADPKFSLAHLMLARAWNRLGYEQKRKEEAKKALDLSIDLPRIERLQVEGDYYQSIPDYEKAASTYRALFELFPDNVDYGLQLAVAQKAAGHNSEAKQTVAQLRRLPPPASDDPRIDMEDALTQEDKPAALALARSVMRKAEAQGKKLLYAQAEKLECVDMVYSSQVEAQPACEDAYRLFWAAGNRLEAADAVRLMADLQGGLGHFGQAILTHQRALKILEPLGEHEKTGMILNNMAIAFTNQGNLDRGEELYRQAKFHFEHAGDKYNTATTMVNIADILYARGKLSPAEKLYRQVINIDTELEVPHYYPDYQLADLKLTEGQVEEAHKLAQQAVDSLRPIQGPYQYLTSALNVLGEVLKVEGNPDAARQQFQAALDTAKKAGSAYSVAQTQVEVSDLALDEDHPGEAEPLLRAAIAEFEKQKTDPDSAGAYIELSRTLLMEGKVEDARKALQYAADLSRTFPDPALKLPIAIQSARLMLAAVRKNEHGHPSLAAVRQQLRFTTDTARKLGYYGEECESQLALGELEMKANPKLGRSLLTHLATDAHQHGMELIARKAMTLGAGSKGTVEAAPPSLPN
jgi:eukaryotic-like serine/threonine-protein kinase